MTQVDIKGTAGGRPATLKGAWKEAGLQTAARLEITAEGIPLDEKLLTALPEGLAKLGRSFRAAGRGDGRALIVRTPGVKDVHCTYHVRLYDTSVNWTEFPLPLKEVSGNLDIYPTHWEFRDFRGKHGEGLVQVRGKGLPRQEGQQEGRIVLDLTGTNLPLDQALRQALEKKPGLCRVWETFSPKGKLNFSAHIDRVPGKPEALDAILDLRGCSIVPSFFRYVLEDFTGKFHYCKDRVEMTHVTARHGATRMSMTRGTVDLYPGGGFYAELDDLRGNPVLPDPDLVEALPESLRTACKTLEVRDPFAFKTHLIVFQSSDPGALPDLYWNGQLWLREARLNLGVEVEQITGWVGCRGRHNGRQLLGLSANVLLDRATVFKQPFRGTHAHLLVKESAPEVLIVDRLKAPIFGGDVSGQARVEFRSEEMRYELNLTGSQIQLEEFGKHNLGGTTQLSGVAAARLHLTGQGNGVASLDGNGSIDVPYSALTRLYNLPLLLDLLKFLGLRWPDRTAFEEAHASFSIHGNRVDIARLDLLGNVVSLWGRGDVKLDGSDVRLDFYPSWARMEQMLPPVIRSIPPVISKNLLKIEVRGKVTGNPSDLQFHKKPIPLLVDPLLGVRDLVTGKKS